MGVILAMSSQVADGSVGLSAIAPVLTRLGRESVLLPTTLLSNHPRYPAVAGAPVAPDRLRSMIDAIAANDRLASVRAVLTGYLPTAEHVAVAAELIERARDAARRPVRVIVDPVLGDDPQGLYIDARAADAVAERLLPEADMATPNRFELEWLSGRAIKTEADAVAAAHAAPPPVVIATSAPSAPRAGAESLATLRVETVAGGGAPRGARVVTPRRPRAPHGAGDALSAFLAGGWPLGRAVAAVDWMIEASPDGALALPIAETADAWIAAEAIRETPLLAEPATTHATTPGA